MEIDLHRLELRFAATRISDAQAVQRLADSIEANGQLVECVAAGQAADLGLVLIDGYRRVAALRRLRRDTALVQCWSCSVGEALTQLLARAGSRPFMPIEEALLLRELIDAHGLTQRDAARQCARDVSWVQRRLMLLGGLPEALLQAVREARVSSWAATRVFVPLARANSEHATRVLSSLDAQPLSTRELWSWFDHYQGAQRTQRERMVEHPRLFIDSLTECERSRDAKRLRDGPEREALTQLGHLHSLLERVRRRLEPLSTPVPVPLARACRRVHASLPDVVSELRRLCDDPHRDPQQRDWPASTILAARRQLSWPVGGGGTKVLSTVCSRRCRRVKAGPPGPPRRGLALTRRQRRIRCSSGRAGRVFSACTPDD